MTAKLSRIANYADGEQSVTGRGLIHANNRERDSGVFDLELSGSLRVFGHVVDRIFTTKTCNRDGLYGCNEIELELDSS